MTRQPNILWYCTDQQRWDTIRAVGQPHIETPTLDWLCANGVAFDRAYSQSQICTPARASFLTGRYPASHHVYRNGNAYFPAHEKLVTRIFADAGYDCGLVGKLHLTAAKYYESAPTTATGRSCGAIIRIPTSRAATTTRRGCVTRSTSTRSSSTRRTTTSAAPASRRSTTRRRGSAKWRSASSTKSATRRGCCRSIRSIRTHRSTRRPSTWRSWIRRSCRCRCSAIPTSNTRSCFSGSTSRPRWRSIRACGGSRARGRARARPGRLGAAEPVRRAGGQGELLRDDHADRRPVETHRRRC
ncbi:MAG: sulfatase-like hydrolase/transferase [Betaproteobacteria bacterium]|nr:sulfatase-like hydrolase/transferase [Betaproteobacteria bacterium]